MQKSIKYQKQNQKDQETIKSFDELYGKSLQGNVTDKTEYELLCNIFTKNVVETKNASFL